MESLVRAAIGICFLLFILWLLSENRSSISWRLVLLGLAMQLSIALGIQYVPLVGNAFGAMSDFFVSILDFTRAGSEFLFGSFMDTESHGMVFAFQILPTIIFFSALTSVLFYFGVIQKVVSFLAWLMVKTLKISGAESLSVAGNIFLGQTESPLLIKAYLEKMNRSELLLVMVGGMSTLAGGVLAAYVAFLGGDDPLMRAQVAKHLLMASVMAAPGAVVASKMLLPQTDKVTSDLKISSGKLGSNLFEAMAIGTAEGMKLAVNVAAMLLVFIAFMAMFNAGIAKVGEWTRINSLLEQGATGNSELSLQLLLGYLFAPFMYLIGVPWSDILPAGRLLGEKIVMSEFIAYISLADIKANGQMVYQKSVIMATFMLAGFANFASIGIQIGGIGTIAPGKRTQLSQLGIKALVGGTIASLISATMAGLVLV